MPRTTTAPLDDRSMWRRLLRIVHPDAGGDGDLFVWCRHLQEQVAGGAPADPPRHERRDPPRHSRPRTDEAVGDRLDFSPASDKAATFDDLTHHAVLHAEQAGQPYAGLLLLLADCEEATQADHVLYRQQNQGATYKSLAAIGYRVGMSKAERTRWYRVAESVPLSQRHAGHILSKLQREG